MKQWISLLLVCLITACAAKTPQTPIVTPSPTQVTSSTPFPTLPQAPTHTPVPTLTPTITPISPPRTPPYWFAGVSIPCNDCDDSFLVRGDWDGFGQERIDLPDNTYIKPVRQSLSPDGNWLVYHSGSLDQNNLTINLFSIQDKTSRTVARTLQQDYVINLAPLAAALEQEQTCPNGASCQDWPSIIRMMFETSISTRNFAWSPDSRWLAFAAQIDGPSTDLYLYDVQSGQLRRMVDDTLMIEKIEWSPDGRWILLYNMLPNPLGEYFGSALHFISLESPLLLNTSPAISGNWWTTLGWWSADELLVARAGDGGPMFNLRAYHIINRQYTTLWPNDFGSFAFDPDSGWMAISGPGDGNPEEGYHIHLIDNQGNQLDVGKGDGWDLAFRNGTQTRFIYSVWSGLARVNVYTVDLNGTQTLLTESIQSGFRMDISPDKRWLLISDQRGMQLFSEADQKVLTVPQKTESVLWRPDSSGVFVELDGQFSFISLPDLKVDPLPEFAQWYKLDQAIWLQE